MSKKRKNDTGIPDYQIESLARVLLPIFREYLASEEGQSDYALWKAERDKEKRNKKSINTETEQ